MYNEFDEYNKGRYLSAGEAAYRLMGFHISSITPSVTTLPAHLPGSTRHHQYHRNGGGSQLSKLDRYFLRPDGTFLREGLPCTFDSLTYTEFYTLFRLASFRVDQLGLPTVFRMRDPPLGQTTMLAIQRDGRNRHFSRLATVLPSAGEVFYMRKLLQVVPARSYQDLRTISDGRVLPTFQAATLHRGLFNDDTEADTNMAEAVSALRTPCQLRVLFVTMMKENACPVPLRIWNNFHVEMSRDFYFQNRSNQALATELTLQDLDFRLEEHGKSSHFYGLPQPRNFPEEVAHELRRWGSDRETLATRTEASIAAFNPEQRAIFDAVRQSVESGEPILAFIDGKAGRGKTFLVKTICDWIRSRGEIIIPTASTAYAALMYQGGRTLHSAFKVR